jgi:hypothetical protein
MNDDFLKKYQKEPDQAFVNDLYGRLGKQEQRNRRSRKFTRTLISGLATCLMVLVGLAAVSPSARAAIREFLLSFNGVEVYRNIETGNLEAEGNLDAVVIQEDHVIGIESDDGTELEVVAEIDVQASEMEIEELLSIYPDFVLPTNLPEGYSLEPYGLYISEDHGFTIFWSNPNGETISLTRTKTLVPKPPTREDGVVVEVEVSMQTGYELRESASGEMQAVYTWTNEAYTYHYMLTASDSSISEAELAAIAD